MAKSRLITRWGMPLVYIILGLAWFSFPMKSGIFPLDDTYIHLSYVRNLAQTGTLCFNPGEPSIGTSSPLWVVILSIFYLSGIKLYWAAQFLSLLFFGVLCFLTTDTVNKIALRLNFSEKEARTCSVLAGLLLVLNGNLHWFALSGMETMLFLCLCFLSIKLYCRYGFDYRVGALSGLVFLTRSPGALLGIIFILFELIRKRFSSVYKGIIAMALVIISYLFIVMSISGNLFPTTARGKLLTYIDSGFNWEVIAKKHFDADLLVQLEAEKIITNDPKSDDYFYFSKDIKNERQLAEQLQKIGISDEIKPLLVMWRMSRKNRIVWYLKSLFIYQKYQPQNFILLAVICMMPFIVVHKYRRRFKDFMKAVLDEYLECSILLAWGVGHLALYAIGFRSLFHHTRYLANEYIILAILGSLSILLLHRKWPKIKAGILLGVACFILTAGSLSYWQEVYANNINQIDEAYIKMGEWINKNTPADARIAAFDVGILRYIGNRYTIDLGGVVDPTVHPCLKKRECGEYLRKKAADYILYSRIPETDAITGIYLAEYQGPRRLKQIPVVHFEAPQYEAPTLTQSYRTDLSKISGWFPPTSDGELQLFSYDGRPFEPVGKMVDERLEFVGFSIDQRVIRYIPPYPFIVNISYFYKAKAQLKDVYWVHLALFDQKLDKIHFSFKHIPTHNHITPKLWPLNKVIQERHARFVPVDIKPQKFRLKVTINQEELLDKNAPDKYSWFDLGLFEIKKNLINPLNVMPVE